MLTLSSSAYKQEDYQAFIEIMVNDLNSFIDCPNIGTSVCSSCRYKRPCYDLNYLYDYLKKKL